MIEPKVDEDRAKAKEIESMRDGKKASQYVEKEVKLKQIVQATNPLKSIFGQFNRTKTSCRFLFRLSR